MNLDVIKIREALKERATYYYTVMLEARDPMEEKSARLAMLTAEIALAVLKEKFSSLTEQIAEAQNLLIEVERLENGEE